MRRISIEGLVGRVEKEMGSEGRGRRVVKPGEDEEVSIDDIER